MTNVISIIQNSELVDQALKSEALKSLTEFHAQTLSTTPRELHDALLEERIKYTHIIFGSSATNFALQMMQMNPKIHTLRFNKHTESS